MTTSVLVCPSCGSPHVLAIERTIYIVTERGAGTVHFGEPYGNPKLIFEDAQAFCNVNGCDWTGTVKEALP